MDLVTFAAVSKKEKVPERLTAVVGVKVIAVVQLPPAKRLLQFVTYEKSAPERAISRIKDTGGVGVCTGAWVTGGVGVVLLIQSKPEFLSIMVT
jgi:sulfopyruvate decarboxylase TPP-binding subunit